MSTDAHKKTALKKVTFGIITLSSTRTLAEDESGHWIMEEAIKEGHKVVYHRVIPDDAAIITETVQNVIREISPHILLMTGGTGISPKDVTIEAVRPLFEKELIGFGTLFTCLSFKEIHSAAILSRATAGIIGKTTVFCVPGSLNACKLACKALIFPEMGHLVKHLYDK